MEEEIWKDIPGYTGYYKISNHGQVFSVRKNIILNPKFAGHGYLRTTLSLDGVKKQFYIHRIVAVVFLGEPPKGKNEINHIDSNKENNYFENLEWSSRKENLNHAYENGSIDFRRKIRVDNTTGKSGVFPHLGGYCAHISINRKKIDLGWYKDVQVAIAVRKLAEKGIFFNENFKY